MSLAAVVLLGAAPAPAPHNDLSDYSATHEPPRIFGLKPIDHLQTSSEVLRAWGVSSGEGATAHREWFVEFYATSPRRPVRVRYGTAEYQHPGGRWRMVDRHEGMIAFKDYATVRAAALPGLSRWPEELMQARGDPSGPTTVRNACLDMSWGTTVQLMASQVSRATLERYSDCDAPQDSVDGMAADLRKAARALVP